MTERIAYCGLICETCPIYLATREDNAEVQAELRAEIVQFSRDQYSLNFRLEDITDCDGCRSNGGRLFSACKACPIRNCARERGMENCAHCADYACANLEAFFKTDPSAKMRLEEIRRKL